MQREQIVRMGGGAALIILIIAIAALTSYGRSLYPQPWFWLWVVAILVAAAALAVVLSSEARNRSRNQRGALVRDVLIGGGLALIVAGLVGLALDPTVIKTVTVPSTLRIAVVLLVVVGLGYAVHRAYARTPTDGRQKDVMTWLLGVYLSGLVMTPFLPLQGSDWVVLDFVAVMTSLGAAFFGFLFGLPQTTAGVPASGDGAQAQSDAAGRNPRWRPSTNLETVADQLTKFITGAAFASLAVATGYIASFGDLVARALGAQTAAGALLGDMLLVGYGTLGFTIAYIVTRTELSLSFRQADTELLSEASIVIAAVLPDIGPGEATDEQRITAKKVAMISFDSLRGEGERLTWARAQTVLGDSSKARRAYAVIYADNPTNPDVLIEFATAIYNDTSVNAQAHVLALLDEARALVAPEDARRQSRIVALTAATNLYISGGYMTTIDVVNAFLRTGAAASKNIRFYRACAFGQLYRAYKDANRLSKADDAAITARITNDTAITVAFGETYRDQMVDVANPKAGSTDDDLQAFAADHPQYAKELLGLANPPPYPVRKPSGEPRVVDPLTNGKTPAELAAESPT